MYYILILVAIKIIFKYILSRLYHRSVIILIIYVLYLFALGVG